MPYITPIELESLNNRSNLMQSRLWGLTKGKLGKHPLAFRIHWKGQRDTLLLFINHAADNVVHAYVPWAPAFFVPEDQRGTFLERLSTGLKRHLPADCLFIRYDLPWKSPYSDLPEEPPDRLREVRMNYGTSDRNLRKAPTDIQPVHTRLLDLRRDEDELLGRMKPKTRYNIRLSHRRGVRVVDAEYDRLPEWYRMYTETAKRKGIYPHEYRQFEELLRTAGKGCLPNTSIHLLFAGKDSEPLAGMILAVHGETATYLYGASSSRKRHLMPTYRLQWHAIRLARASLCSRYDLFGIPPDNNPSHPMHGLYTFKTGFGGYTLQRQGCWDYPFRKREYTVYTGKEAAAGGYHLR